jgi:hypothetical protein
MSFPALIRSFRARLLLLLALMFGLTLGVQYYFNLRAVKANAHKIIAQEQAIMTGVALAIQSLRSEQYLDDIIGDNDALLNSKDGRVRNILVVDDSGNVIDSVIPDYAPSEHADKTPRYVQFKDIPLPPLHNAAQVPREQEQLPSWMPSTSNVDFGQAGAFYFPVETGQRAQIHHRRTWVS